MTVLGLVLTIVVMVAIAVAVALFERRRARGIERDLKDQAARRRGLSRRTRARSRSSRSGPTPPR